MDTSDFIDVALCKPAFQSTQHGTHPFGASGCLQPRVGPQFGFHTDLEDKAWWYVDLLCTYPIDRIVVFNRSDSCFERCRTLCVEISEDSMVWTVLHDGLVFFGYDEENDRFVIPISGMLKGRYVRLSLKERAYLHLRKVQVFARMEHVKAAERNFQGFPYAAAGPFIERKLEISVIGTSNSIMQGFLPALEKHNIRVVSNRSIGSSHSTMVPYRLCNIEENIGDIILLDFCPNEQQALRRGFDFLATTSDVLDDVKCWCATRNVIPVGLVLPYRQSYTSDVHRRMREEQERLFISKGIPFFSGYDFVEAVANLWQRPIDSFFIDDVHLNKFAARCLGSLLGASLLKLFSRLSNPGLKIDVEAAIASAMVAVEASDAQGTLKCIQRKTSIMSANFIRLEEQQHLIFDVPMGSEVVGLVLNMAQTNGAVVIEGVDTLTKRLDNSFFNEQVSVWLVVWSLLKPVTAGSDGIRITCADATRVRSFESNDHQDDSFVNDGSKPIIVELQGIVVRHPKSSRRMLMTSGIDYRLSRDLNLSLFSVC